MWVIVFLSFAHRLATEVYYFNWVFMIGSVDGLFLCWQLRIRGFCFRVTVLRILIGKAIFSKSKMASLFVSRMICSFFIETS